MSRRIMIVGATGLVGSACLRRLISENTFDRVVVLSRRELPPELRRPDTSGKIEEHVIDFDRLEEAAPVMAVDTVICALGTTIGKAGSRERFREDDFEYTYAIARLSRNQGARHYLLVSALGADPASRIFYNRVKGEVEHAIGSLEFPGITIVRPSLLQGQRNEFRLGETLAKRLAFLLPRKYKPVAADDVAKILVEAAIAGSTGTEIIESADILGRAR